MSDAPQRQNLETGSAAGEKRGGTSWASCRACAAWFPIDVALTRDPKLVLHCPKCGDRFPADRAKRLVLAR